ncbi:hypothetical protein Slin15195_G009440 [Septoria linicola]|uniref:Uncharacterized protein n=1 Tax=Septoria linicola TaxID=215465 RepID=A0A9Q9EE87_9PEZI|nr:hypothetical protein Slin14017_G009450 [Septoria linicola]USW47625.1 hypothetical protein Slin15195_G009440 [Septoria linicola]
MSFSLLCEVAKWLLRLTRIPLMWSLRSIPFGGVGSNPAFVDIFLVSGSMHDFLLDEQ